MYVLERFLARLAVSRYTESFVLKGGMLLAAMDARRPTLDADLLADHLANDEASVVARVVEIASLPVDVDDGVEYLTDTTAGRTIREDSLYAGIRVTMATRVSSAEVKLQLDINFGNPVTPAPTRIDYPTLRPDTPAIRLLGYPLATVLAEKLVTAVDLGAANSRVRDFADIWTRIGRHRVDAAELRAALEATAGHRGLPLRPLSGAVAALAATREGTYTAFRRRLDKDGSALPLHLAAVLHDVVAFADPVLSDPPLVRHRWDPVDGRWHALG
ncbi:MAG: nucleotidyl transferase AbiEii/AbiGii toxin family protein [Kineosporiaceae bacterium]